VTQIGTDALARPRLGISACLLGQAVRYDGGHKLDRFLQEELGRLVEWVPVCPEVECGLGVPREAMRLVGDPDSPRLLTHRSGVDLTAQMKDWARVRLAALEREDLLGFVFKSRSPSSGLRRVKVYDTNGVPGHGGVGIFARALVERFPLLPVEEDERLHDPALRVGFIERIFCLARYRSEAKSSGKIADLIGFHARQKIQLMAHSPALLREMNALLARARDFKARQLASRYEALLLQTLAVRVTAPRMANAIQHMLGHFKRELSADEQQEMAEILAQYRQGLLPLIVPMVLVQHHVRRFRPAYLIQQSVLAPHPLELKLRNHA